MYSFSERDRIVLDFGERVKKSFLNINEYNVILFGSFLTDEYSALSDIDIAVFSLDSALMRRIYWFTEEYFENMGIPCDVIEIRLSDTQYIAANAILDHKYEVTDYVPDELLQYVKHMVSLYGNNPMKYAINQLSKEVDLHGRAWG